MGKVQWKERLFTAIIGVPTVLGSLLYSYTAFLFGLIVLMISILEYNNMSNKIFINILKTLKPNTTNILTLPHIIRLLIPMVVIWASPWIHGADADSHIFAILVGIILNSVYHMWYYSNGFYHRSSQTIEDVSDGTYRCSVILLFMAIDWVFLILYVSCMSISTLTFDRDRSMIRLWIVCTWAADTGGLVVGSTIGCGSFAPVISPAKTRQGLMGALIFSVVSCVVMYSISRYSDVLPHMSIMWYLITAFVVQ
eukprot:GHVR01004514.1.p1 GENE.GHVR01004514.1~~GHVR01004514.1.p1  ORF type:complete len:253 (+),score=36.61 GHVR01004514.1:44-802(+)